MTKPIYNTEDVIDSRDVIARIEDLKETDDLDEDEQAELKTLEALASQGEDYADDWEYGSALINADYFITYAQEFANEITHMVTDWPHNHIDWKAAAAELKEDYIEIDFDGQSYFIQ